jgi:hypothetical protein
LPWAVMLLPLRGAEKQCATSKLTLRVSVSADRVDHNRTAR